MLYRGWCRCQPEWPGMGLGALSGGPGTAISTRVVVPPDYEPITLSAAKTAHRIELEATEDDEYLLSLISAAREYAEAYLGLSLIKQTREADYAFWEPTGPMRNLPFGPVRSVEPVATPEPGQPYVVRYVAGYDPWEPVPRGIIVAMQLCIGEWYEAREQSVIGKSVAPIGLGVHQLLDFYRVRLGMA